MVMHRVVSFFLVKSPLLIGVDEVKIWKKVLLVAGGMAMVTGLFSVLYVSPVTLCVSAIAFFVFGILCVGECIRSLSSFLVNEGIRGWIQATFGELASLGRILAWYFRDLTEENPTGKVEQSGQPILLIHGLWHSSSGWTNYRKWLLEKGCGPVFTLNIPSTNDFIEENGKYVTKKIQEIVDLTGRKDILLIGHSRGGIIASWVATEEGQDAVKGVITLGAPLQGTKLALFSFFRKNAEQMQWQSPFMQSFKERLNSNTKVLFHHFGSTTDAIIIPQHSAIRDAKHSTVIPYLGHLSYLVSRQVFDRVFAVIRDFNGQQA